MKRLLYISLLVLVAALAYTYRGKLPFFRERLDSVSQQLSQNATIQDIQKQIFTSGPLRGRSAGSGGTLTIAGVIQLTNAERAQNNLPTLKENALLDQAAENKLKDMFQKQYFEHISPEGRGPGDLAQQVHYDYIVIGENLAMGNFKDDNELVQAWMNSPGHRANILGARFTEIGVAVGKGTFEGKTAWMAVQEFGKPVADCPAIDISLKSRIQVYQSETETLKTQLDQLKAEMENMDPKTKKEYDDYNQKVSEYNALVKMYNNKVDVLKQLISDYNQQVSSYNQCAAR